MLGETVRGKGPLATRAPYLSGSHDIHGEAEVTREMRRGNEKGTHRRRECNQSVTLSELEGGNAYERI